MQRITQLIESNVIGRLKLVQKIFNQTFYLGISSNFWRCDD